MRMLSILPLAALVAAGVRIRAAEACIPITQPALQLDPAFADDTVAPLPIREVTYSVGRRIGGDCDDLAGVWIRFATGDDRTTFGRLGYEVRGLSGTHDELSLWSGARVAAEPGELLVYYQDEGQDLDATIEVVAVDLNGNRSEGVAVRVQDDTFGCAVGRGGSSRAGVLLVLAASLLAVRSRGVRARRA